MSVFLPRAFPSRVRFSTVVPTEEKVREERETATETKRDTQRDTEEERKTDSAGETQALRNRGFFFCYLSSAATSKFNPEWELASLDLCGQELTGQGSFRG